MFKGSSSRKGIVKKLRGKRQEKNRFLKPRRLNVESLERRQLLAAGVLSIACPTLTGKDSPLFVVSISPAPAATGPVTVAYTTEDLSTGAAGKSGNLTFTADAASEGITLKEIGNNLWGRNHAPGVHDVIALNLIPPTGVTGSSAAIATILEDGSDPPTLSMSGPSVITEGTAGVFTISLTGNASLSPLTIGYTAFDGHATTAGTLTFSTADTSTQAITITAFDDHLWVPVSENESVSLTLSLPGGVGGTTSQTATIAEDSDDTPTLNVSSGAPSVTEGSALTLTASLSGDAPESPLTVGYSAWNGQSQSWGSVTFNSIVTSRTFCVSAYDDGLWDPSGAGDGSVSVGLSLPTGILGGTLSTIATIVELPSLSGRGRWRDGVYYDRDANGMSTGWYYFAEGWATYDPWEVADPQPTKQSPPSPPGFVKPFPSRPPTMQRPNEFPTNPWQDVMPPRTEPYRPGVIGQTPGMNPSGTVPNTKLNPSGKNRNQAPTVPTAPRVRPAPTVQPAPTAPSLNGTSGMIIPYDEVGMEFSQVWYVNEGDDSADESASTSPEACDEA